MAREQRGQPLTSLQKALVTPRDGSITRRGCMDEMSRPFPLRVHSTRRGLCDLLGSTVRAHKTKATPSLFELLRGRDCPTTLPRCSPCLSPSACAPVHVVPLRLALSDRRRPRATDPARATMSDSRCVRYHPHSADCRRLRARTRGTTRSIHRDPRPSLASSRVDSCWRWAMPDARRWPASSMRSETRSSFTSRTSSIRQTCSRWRGHAAGPPSSCCMVVGPWYGRTSGFNAATIHRRSLPLGLSR